MKFTLALICCLMLALAACRQPPAENRPPAVAQMANSNQRAAAVSPCVNLNTASAEELQTLPGVGEARARQIIEYRKRHGGFRRPQEVIILEGFSERHYRAIAARLCQ